MTGIKRGLTDKQVILGVSGGIAAYKSVELLRGLVKQGAQPRVTMTANACRFVGPLTFQALSGRPVCTGLFEESDDAAIRHIDWAREADLVVVAPATANFIGKLANGIADDALSTMLLAVTAPVAICPSMNTHMYENAAVQRNIERLRLDGRHIIEPAAGELACGTTGAGRLPEPAFILDRLEALLTEKDLSGKRVLVTAGPTHEAIDPVRFLTNPSSGKMGFAVATAAEHRGARVTLVSGPSHLPPPAAVDFIPVCSAMDMAEAVLDRMDGVDIVIKAAAVSDFRPAERAAHKIKKDKAEMTLTLQKNPDILKELGRRRDGQILVGFAAETQSLETNATGKLAAKHLDMIVANRVGGPDSGFLSDTNSVTFFFKDGTQESLPSMDKMDVAHILLDRVVDRFVAS